VVPVVPVVLVPVVVPAVGLALALALGLALGLALVVACPHASNANTKRKVRAANIVRKYGTNLSPLVHILIACFTLVHRCKYCKP